MGGLGGRRRLPPTVPGSGDGTSRLLLYVFF